MMNKIRQLITMIFLILFGVGFFVMCCINDLHGDVNTDIAVKMPTYVLEVQNVNKIEYAAMIIFSNLYAERCKSNSNIENNLTETQEIINESIKLAYLLIFRLEEIGSVEEGVIK